MQDKDRQEEVTGNQIWAQWEEQSVQTKDELGVSWALSSLSPGMFQEVHPSL